MPAGANIWCSCLRMFGAMRVFQPLPCFLVRGSFLGAPCVAMVSAFQRVSYLTKCYGITGGLLHIGELLQFFARRVRRRPASAK